jgi:hypothetical protein
MSREAKIAESLARKAAGAWSWDLIGSDGKRVGLQLIYQIGKRYVKIDELNDLV